MVGFHRPSPFPFLPEPPEPFSFEDAFDYTPADLVGQGPWIASADPSLVVAFANLAQSPNDNAVYGAKAPLVGAPAFDQAWELEFNLSSFLASGSGNGTAAAALRVGILQIAISLALNHSGSSLTYNVWGGSITGGNAYDFNAEMNFKLTYDGAGISRFYIDGVLKNTVAQAPGPDVPDQLVLSNLRNTDDFQGFSFIRFAAL